MKPNPNGDAVECILLGFFLMIPFGMLFDAMRWPLFHSWGLAHGSFILAWPLLTLASFGVIRALTSLITRPTKRSRSN